MALTNAKLKEILSKAGVSADKISATVDEIMVGHNTSIDALTEERDKYKEKAKKLDSVQKQLDEANQAMVNGDKSPYKVKYEAKVEEIAELQKQFDDFKADVDAKAITAQKTDAYRQLLKDAGVNEKRIDAVLRVSDIEALKLDADGKLKDADKLTEAIKSEWSDFIVEKTEQGANVPNPPQGGNGGAVLTKEEILKIQDTSERQQAWARFIEQERNK